MTPHPTFSPLELPNDPQRLKQYIETLCGLVGHLTLEKSILQQQLHQADAALCDIEQAATNGLSDRP